MAIDVTIDTTIARSPNEVFAAIADIERWPSWLRASGIDSVERTSSGAVEAGERFAVRQQAAGRLGTFDTIASAVEAPTRFAVDGRDPDGVSISIEASLAGSGNSTALRWSIRIGLPFRYRIFESMARPQVERAAALDIDALRRRLESAPTD